MPGLKEFYQKECVPQLMQEFGYTNLMQVPMIEKIVLNMGLGEAVQNPKIVDSASNELSMIAGQKTIINKSKKSIAGFKLRQGIPIGCSVTLRKEIMYNFLNKLLHVALPRVRDFRGVSSKGFDGKGNFSMGIKEHIIFPEIDYDKIDKIKGFNITIVTTAKTDGEGLFLLKALGMPFKK
ncbi:MAG: 50S ribosomal protein L5 [Deltaproteobacteria bacterium RIFOXYD12_FULL_50_9]|nr:MAG: 50S ribosomal protein L5 [Deltaproteobacteria bacterium RIFOXYD12_FULL_50_9]